MTSTGEDFYIIPCENEYGNEHAAAVTPGGIKSGDKIVIFEIDGELFGYKPSGVVGQEMMYLNFAGAIGGGWYPQGADEEYVGDTIIIVPVEGDKEDLIALIDIPNFFSISGTTHGLSGGRVYYPVGNNLTWGYYILGGDAQFNRGDCSGLVSVTSEVFRVQVGVGKWISYFGPGHNVVGIGCQVPVPIHGIEFEYRGAGVTNVSSYNAMCSFENSPNVNLSLDGSWHKVFIGPYPSRYALAPSTHNMNPMWSNPFLVGSNFQQTTSASGHYTFWIYMDIPAPNSQAMEGRASVALRNIKTVRY